MLGPLTADLSFTYSFIPQILAKRAVPIHSFTKDHYASGRAAKTGTGRAAPRLRGLGHSPADKAGTPSTSEHTVKHTWRLDRAGSTGMGRKSGGSCNQRRLSGGTDFWAGLDRLPRS